MQIAGGPGVGFPEGENRVHFSSIFSKSLSSAK